MAFCRIGLLHRLDDYPRASDRHGRERSTARSAQEADARRVDVLVAALAVTSIVGMSVLEGYGDIAAVVLGLLSAVLGLRLGVLKAHQSSSQTTPVKDSRLTGRSTEHGLAGSQQPTPRRTPQPHDSPRIGGVVSAGHY